MTAVFIQEHPVVLAKVARVKPRTDEVVAKRQSGDRRHDRDQYDHASQKHNRIIGLG
jgi:hypothetical protein